MQTVNERLAEEYARFRALSLSPLTDSLPDRDIKHSGEIINVQIVVA